MKCEVCQRQSNKSVIPIPIAGQRTMMVCQEVCLPSLVEGNHVLLRKEQVETYVYFDEMRNLHKKVGRANAHEPFPKASIKPTALSQEQAVSRETKSEPQQQVKRGPGRPPKAKEPVTV